MGKESDPAYSFDCRILELRTEAQGCTDPDERRGIQEELTALQTAATTRERRAEELEGLPFVWQTIYGQGAGILALLAGDRVGRKLARTTTAYFHWPEQTDQAGAWVHKAGEDRELYHTAHLLTQPRRRAEHAAPLWSLYADLDDAKVRPEMPTPTLVVETSPGRLQAYWQLTESVAPDVGAAVNRQLAYALGADKSGWDLTQVLRIPGTFNHKHEGSPLVRVVHHGTQCYDLAAVVNPLPDLPLFQYAGEHSSPPRRVEAAAMPQPLSAAAQRVWNGEDVKLTTDGRIDRSASLVRIARIGLAAGLDHDQLAAALAERDDALGWRKYAGRADAIKQYEVIVRVVERGARTQYQ